MTLMLIMKVPTPSDQQKEPCPRAHHRRSTRSWLSWSPQPMPAGCLARVCWPCWRGCRIRANDGVCGIRSRQSWALAVCAVLAGCRSFTAIGQWAANASDQILAALEVGGCAPCESTIRRTLQRLDGDELDAAIGGWAAARTEPPAGTRRAVAIDGKTVRGSGGSGRDARHLLAAIDHRSGVVLGQVDVDTKTNKITRFLRLVRRHRQPHRCGGDGGRFAHAATPRRLSGVRTRQPLPAHRQSQPARFAPPAHGTALKRHPTGSYLHGSCSRPGGATHRQGSDSANRDRLPTRPPGHPDHPQDPTASDLWSLGSSRLCQISGGRFEASAVDVAVDVVIKCAQGLA